MKTRRPKSQLLFVAIAIVAFMATMFLALLEELDWRDIAMIATSALWGGAVAFIVDGD